MEGYTIEGPTGPQDVQETPTQPPQAPYAEQGLNDFPTGQGIDIFQGGGPELCRVTATDYQFISGLIVGPIAAADTDNTVPSAAVMRVHKEICFKVMRWAAARSGDKPVLPHWDTQNSNEVLIYKEITGSLPGVDGGGQQYWSIAGVYVYVLMQPPQQGDALTVGGSWIAPQYTATANQILPSDFVKALSGPAPSVQSLVPNWYLYLST